MLPGTQTSNLSICHLYLSGQALWPIFVNNVQVFLHQNRLYRTRFTCVTFKAFAKSIFGVANTTVTAFGVLPGADIVCQG